MAFRHADFWCRLSELPVWFVGWSHLSFRHVSSSFRHVVSSRPLREPIIWRTLHEVFTWFHALRHDIFIHNFAMCWLKRDSLKSYLWPQLVEETNSTNYDGVNERFHENENGTGYLVTHLDRVLYILACASSLIIKHFHSTTGVFITKSSSNGYCSWWW